MSFLEKRRRTAAGVTAAAALIGAGTGAATVALVGSSGDTVVRQVTVASADNTAATSGGLTNAQIYDRSRKGVVEIAVSSTSSTPFGDQSTGGQGSGFVYDEQGTIVTNQHVVDGAARSPSRSGTARRPTRPSSAPTRRPTSPSSTWTWRPTSSSPLKLGDSDKLDGR